MKQILALGAIGLIGFALIVRAEAPNDSPIKADLPNAFAGKFVSVVLEPTGRVPTYVLQDAKIQKIGGREYVVGVCADTRRPKDTAVGWRVGVALDRVTAFFEFTKEEFDEECENAFLDELDRMKLIPSLDVDIANPGTESPD